MSILKRISKLDAHHRLLWSFLAGSAGFLILEGRVHHPVQVAGSWILFCLTDLAFIWTLFVREDPAAIRKVIKLQDSSRTFLFLLVVAACGISLASVGFILSPSKDMSDGMKAFYAALTFAAVGLSWLLVHTVFAIRYAHLYYRVSMDKHAKEEKGGIEFPDEPDPDYRDFAYFSFVIGMTCQVSDVQVTSRKIRRLVLTHGILSFAFNTIILAFSINVIAGLI